jgi:NAD(P)-dependent dehydrogenase (short-subunit alcohol dehydrogenase family)
MLLEIKTAVIYGAGGAIGSAVARAFAHEGASVFLTGHKRAPIDALAAEITAAGGSAQPAEVNAVDERAVNEHLQSVIDQAGHLDISFNAIGVGETKLGVPLLELDVEQFSLPIITYTRSYFLTARLAARRMIQKKSGVIMTVSSSPARAGTTLNGGYGPAHAAKEAFTRDLSAELAPQGIRVIGLRPHGLPETSTMREVFQAKLSATPSGSPPMTFEQFRNFLANWSHARRSMKVEEVASMAVLMASDKATGMTGTTINLTMGAVSD